jgi:hypothetical protein
MPTPSASLATLRPELGASLEEYNLLANQEGFIAGDVLPVIPVAKQAGPFGRIPIEQLLQNAETRRAPGAGYSRPSNIKFETDTYACVEHGREEPVDDREAAMYGDYLDAEVYAAMRAQHQVLLNREQRVAAAVFNTTTWTGATLTTAVGTPWTTVATATPLADIEAAVKKVWDLSGLWANTLIVSRFTYRALRRCKEIHDLIKYQGFQDVRATAITPNALAQLFDLDRVIVAGGAKNTGADGQAATIASVWSNSYAMVCRTAMSGDVREPCIGRIFHYVGDGSEFDGTVESYRDETVRGDVIRVRHDVHEKILLPQCGHLLSNVG